MIAPSLAELYQIEKHVEQGLASILESKTGVECFNSFSTKTLTTPRIEVSCQLGGATGHEALAYIDGTTRQVHDAWDATLVVTYITGVAERGASAAQHSSVRGLLRYVMATWRGLFTEEAFPYHCVGLPVETGSNVSVNNEANAGEDTSEITWASPVNIRADAWPDSSD